MSLITLLPIIFFISELLLMIFRRSKNTGTQKNGDRNSLLLFWIVIPVCIGTGFTIKIVTAPLSGNLWLTYAGTALAIAGMLIRWLAIIQLGKAFTVNVAIAGDQQLKTNGLYSVVRHPSYTGLFMIITGLALCMNNIFSILIIIVPNALVLAYRIRIEEQMLEQAFGEQYRHYKTHTKKLIPFIY